jgi:hypothetical protein
LRHYCSCCLPLKSSTFADILSTWLTGKQKSGSEVAPSDFSVMLVRSPTGQVCAARQ